MNGQKLQINIIRSNRKTIAVRIDENLNVTVRAPYRCSDLQVREFIREKSDWIEKNIQRMQERMLKKQLEAALHPEKQQNMCRLTMEDIRRLADDAMAYIPERVAYFAPKVGVTYGRITIRNQRSRWGSCSSKGNLNFNCLLMLTPKEIIDYVVVHELCHRLEMNHSKRFWDEVERVLPEYRTQRAWLSENGGDIIRRQLQ